MKRFIWKSLITGILLTGCKTYRTSPVPSFRGGECRVATRAWQDSTYHLIKDSVVVYIGDAGAPPAVSSERTAYPCMSSAGERAPHFAHGLTGTPRGENSEHLNPPPLKEGLGRSHYHTEYRDRVVVKTDTVFCDREVQIQLPPERYVPRAVRWLAWIGAIALFALLLRLLWRLKG